MNNWLPNVLLAVIAILLLCLLLRPSPSSVVAVDSQGNHVFVQANGKLYDYHFDNARTTIKYPDGHQQTTNTLELWGVADLEVDQVQPVK